MRGDGLDFADAVIAELGRAAGCSHTVTFDELSARPEQMHFYPADGYRLDDCVVGMLIRLARSDESGIISALALRSKGHWGYSAEFLESCRAELTYEASECGSGRMWVAENGAELAGFGLLEGEPPWGQLAALFVDPSAIGTGCGKRLLLHVLREAAAAGFTHAELDADPEAEPIYLRFGAERIGMTPNGSIPGRLLPHLVFRLSSAREPVAPPAG